MNFTNSLRTLLLAVILSIGISYTYAAWSPPSVAPTGGNAEAPVNVGGATQVKAGALAVNGLLTAVSNLMIGSCSQPGCPTGPLTINTNGSPWVDIRSSGDANNYSAISLWSNNGGAWPVFSGADSNKRWAIGHRKLTAEANNFFIEECDGNCTNSTPNPANFNQRLTIEPGGNIGVSQKDPTAKLHVGGTPGIDGIRFPDGTLQTTAAGGGGGGVTSITAGTGISINQGTGNVTITNTGGSITKSPALYQCPITGSSCGGVNTKCVGQLSTQSTCNTAAGAGGASCNFSPQSCGSVVGYLVQ